jgi:DNA repair protein RadC
MDDNKEIYLPDTSVKLGQLRNKLRELYGLEITENKINKMENTAYCIVEIKTNDGNTKTSNVMPIEDANTWVNKNCPDNADYDIYFCDQNGDNKQKKISFKDGGFLDTKKDKSGNDWLFPKDPTPNSYGIMFDGGGNVCGVDGEQVIELVADYKNTEDKQLTDETQREQAYKKLDDIQERLYNSFPVLKKLDRQMKENPFYGISITKNGDKWVVKTDEAEEEVTLTDYDVEKYKKFLRLKAGEKYDDGGNIGGSDEEKEMRKDLFQPTNVNKPKEEQPIKKDGDNDYYDERVLLSQDVNGIELENRITIKYSKKYDSILLSNEVVRKDNGFVYSSSTLTFNGTSIHPLYSMIDKFVSFLVYNREKPNEIKKDLFETYDLIPANVQKILDKYNDGINDGDYRELKKAVEELNTIGYTFEYGLSGEAFALRPIGVKVSELYGYEDYDEDDYGLGGTMDSSENLNAPTIGGTMATDEDYDAPTIGGTMASSSYEVGGSIPERYKNMGFTKIGEKKKSNKAEKKWMVLAKKGDQYKVVHGGYKGMEDYTQHKDEERRKRFWQRMGGFNSSKTKDPFSPLYWHKKFGTWEQGGEIPEGKKPYVIKPELNVIQDGEPAINEEPKQDSVREIKLKLQNVDIPTKVVMSSVDAYDFLRTIWDNDNINIQEEFIVLYLNRANTIVSYQRLAKGGVSGVMVDASMVVATATKALASGVILAHNHPSGNTRPSEEDKRLTTKIKSALALVGINLLDHLIVTPDKGYISFADESILYKDGGNVPTEPKTWVAVFSTKDDRQRILKEVEAKDFNEARRRGWASIKYTNQQVYFVTAYSKYRLGGTLKQFTREKVGKVMKEFSAGKLKTSAGKKVKDVKQALAIGYSEAKAGWNKRKKKK